MRTVQSRLGALGFDPGPADGQWGPRTRAAMMAALDELEMARGLSSQLTSLVPPGWMPTARMPRVIVHWTAGTHKANATDRRAYHILIEGDGSLVQGARSIKDNERIPAGAPAASYAAHTRGLNTGSIGVSLCAMAGATESPWNAGRYPVTREQWEALARVCADLCRFYAIPVTPETVLSHAEVQDTLGIRQSAKWDISRLPFDDSLRGARAVGDRLRAMVRAHLN